MSRTFESGPARRERMPLMLAIVGASGAGKTLSALLLAEGIRRVQPGPIVVIDTEALRALKHSDGNPDRFVHVPFGAPFGPLDYIEAFKHAIKHQPSTVIVDSMSHEWEGPGGVLEQHDAHVAAKGESSNMTAWIRPKADHTAMKHFILQQRCNWIFCFRAKEKTAVKANGKPEDLGWQPLGAEDLIYEMDLCALLYPGVDGRPTWRSSLRHEQEKMKLPGWWRALFAGDPQINPDIGEQLARWAAGSDIASPSSTATPSRGTSSAPIATLAERLDECATRARFSELESEMRRDWERIPKGAARTAVTNAFKAADLRTKPATATPQTSGDPDADEAAEIARIETERQRKEAT